MIVWACIILRDGSTVGEGREGRDLVSSEESFAEQMVSTPLGKGDLTQGGPEG